MGVFAALLFPDLLHAWTPGTHIVLGERILGSLELLPAAVADRPVVSKLASQFHLDFNILRSAIDPGNEGMMYLEIMGKADAILFGLLFVVLWLYPSGLLTGLHTEQRVA